MEFEDLFSIQIFFIILRETLESAIIVSVLLSFLKQNFTDKLTGKVLINEKIYKSMQYQVWIGAILGFSICLLIGIIFITLFYFIGTDIWSYAERIWEGIFSILSSLIIAIMGFSLLRINGMKNKWKAKLIESFKAHHHHHDNHDNDNDNDNDNEGVNNHDNTEIKRDSFKKRYFLAFLPFITTLREGLEAVVFIGGIGVNQPVSSFPLAILCGGICGFLIGFLLYKGGNKMSIQYFLILSTCFLYLVAAGLISRGVWFLELEKFVRRCGQDTSETGSGPGSYDISNTIWHVNCCNGLKDGGWMIFNALLGWSNTATYGSVSSYLIFWIGIITILKIKVKFENDGLINWLPIRWQLKYIKKRISIDEILVQEINEMNNNSNTENIENNIQSNDMTPLL